MFNSIIAAHDLIEIGMTGGKFTWSNNQSNPTLVKLDRFLMSKQWEDIFPRVVVSKLPREVSDHNPLILQVINNQTHIKHLGFRFELSWLKHYTFLEKVQEIWETPCHAKSAFDSIQNKLKLFKKYFRGWEFNMQEEKKRKKPSNMNLKTWNK